MKPVELLGVEAGGWMHFAAASRTSPPMRAGRGVADSQAVLSILSTGVASQDLRGRYLQPSDCFEQYRENRAIA